MTSNEHGSTGSGTAGASHDGPMDALDSDQINSTIRYMAVSVYSRVGELEGAADDAVAELTALTAELAAKDVVIRGFYDVSGMRADADLFVWWHAPAAEALQAAARSLRRTAVGRVLTPAWSVMAVHRPAEFNKDHVPVFLTGAKPLAWTVVYPFVRSYDWYLLPEGERAAMLREHGMLGRQHPAVHSNTLAAFALGDYEWILALESDELHELVDMMRHLRTSETRSHVREEVPFFTGRRIDEAGVVEVLQ